MRRVSELLRPQVHQASLLAGLCLSLTLGHVGCAVSGTVVHAPTGTVPSVGSCVAQFLYYGGDGEGEEELKRTAFSYDGTGRVVVADGAPVSYDSQGRIVGIGASRWTRDTADEFVADLGDGEFTRRRKRTDGGFYEFTGHEEDGAVRQRRVALDPRGRVAEAFWSGFSHAVAGRFTYDSRDRAATVTYYDQPSGDLMAAFTFHYGTRGVLRITEASAPVVDDASTSEVTVKFDGAGRMLSWHQVSGETGEGQSVRKYLYDKRGNLVSLTLHSGDEAPDLLFSATYSDALENTWCGRQGTLAWPTQGPHWWHASTIKQALMTESPYQWREHPLGWGRMD